MLNSIIKYENFYSEKVYYCPSLENTVNQTFNQQIYFYTEMMLAISECCVGDSRVFLWMKRKIVCFFSNHIY